MAQTSPRPTLARTDAVHNHPEARDLWDAHQWEELLSLAEKAHAGNNQGGVSSSAASIRRRIRRSVRAGAFRKAVQGLSSHQFVCSVDEESQWARDLLPASGRPLRLPTRPPQLVGGHVPAEDGSSDAPMTDSHSDPRPLRGVRFGAESGPGPSGRRPEHLRDILACPRAKG